VADTLTEQTHRTLRQQIVDGLYRPSQRMVETDLAQSMGVSRISVRSALQRLHQEGLVTIEPHRGAKVTDISLEDAVEVMEVREGLEGWAAALAAERITAADIAELERIIAQMASLLQEGKPLEYSENNALFHKRILEAAGNRRLQKMLDSLQTPLVRYRFRTILVPGRSNESMEEHTEILEAIRARDAGRAERAMRRHVGQVRRTMVEARKLMEL
jgi:DNA-binding GntR family transcriptional regulator